jgi:hypothetical protein
MYQPHTIRAWVIGDNRNAQSTAVRIPHRGVRMLDAGQMDSALPCLHLLIGILKITPDREMYRFQKRVKSGISRIAPFPG